MTNYQEKVKALKAQHEDGYTTAASVETIKKLIAKNRQ